MIHKHSLFLLCFFSIKSFSQTYISELRVVSNDSLINLQKPIKLSLEEKSISIAFNDISDTLAVFEYQLENIELENFKKKYTKAKKNRSIVYESLNGGNYIFRVKNTHNDSKASISFTIELSFFQNWWFIPMMFLYALIVIGIIIYLILLYRFRQQTKLQRVRNDIASDLHDDVGATLSSISFFGEMMRSKILKNAPPEEVLVLLEKVISTSKETIETMRGVVWTINPNNDNAVDFFQKLQSFGREMLAAKNIEFNFQTEGFEKEKLPLEIQRNLFLFYKETINNIAKHSKATQVTGGITPISSKGEGQGVKLFIYDNGIGFNPDDLHEGHGLKSLRKRADELEGKLVINSTEGQGTSITLSFPLP